jgi:hypothetical protein
MPISKNRDDIDVIVDRILASPDRADELKATLRNRMGITRSGYSDKGPSRFAPNDAESLWDNVPV